MNRKFSRVVWAASVAAMVLAVGVASGQSWDDPWEPGSECEHYCPCLKGCPCPAAQDTCLEDACPADGTGAEVAMESAEASAEDEDATGVPAADSTANEFVAEDADYWYDSETKQYRAHQFAENPSVDDSVEVPDWNVEQTGEAYAAESAMTSDDVTDRVAPETESRTDAAVASEPENTSLADPYGFEYDHARNHPFEVPGGAYGTPSVVEDIDSQADMAAAQDTVPAEQMVAGESRSDAEGLTEGDEYEGWNEGSDEPSVEDLADTEVQVVPGEDTADAMDESADEALTIEQLWGIQPEAPVAAPATPDQTAAANQDSPNAEVLLSVARTLDRVSELLHGLSQHLTALAEQELAQNPGAMLHR